MHEAGHAVLAVLAGGFIEQATILPGKGYRGIVRWRQARGSAFLETRIINSLAGAAAGDLALKGINPTRSPVRFLYDDADHALLTGLIEHQPSDTCGSDFCDALSFAIKRRPDATPTSLRLDIIRSQMAVGTILRDPRIWGSIDAVARMLLRQGSCSDAEIRPIVAERVAGADLLTLLRSCRLPLRL